MPYTIYSKFQLGEKVYPITKDKPIFMPCKCNGNIIINYGVEYKCSNCNGAGKIPTNQYEYQPNEFLKITAIKVDIHRKKNGLIDFRFKYKLDNICGKQYPATNLFRTFTEAEAECTRRNAKSNGLVETIFTSTNCDG